MAGRNRGPRYAVNSGPRGLRDEPRPLIMPGSRPLPPHPSVLEDELEMRHEDERRLVSDNRRLADDCLHLQRELNLLKEDINRVGQAIPQVRAEKVIQERELIQNGLKLESELRAFEPLRSEVAKLKAESEKLNASRQELSAKAQGLSKDLARVQTENKQLTLMRADAEVLHQEIMRVREAFEYEQKARLEQMEQKQLMEKNLLSLHRELEKLQAGGTYSGLKGSTDLGYTSTFGDTYRSTWGSYDRQGPPRY